MQAVTVYSYLLSNFRTSEICPYWNCIAETDVVKLFWYHFHLIRYTLFFTGRSIKVCWELKSWIKYCVKLRLLLRFLNIVHCYCFRVPLDVQMFLQDMMMGIEHTNILFELQQVFFLLLRAKSTSQFSTTFYVLQSNIKFWHI